MKNKLKKKGGTSICYDSDIKTRPDSDMYSFDTEFFMFFLYSYSNFASAQAHNQLFYITNLNVIMSSCDSLLLNFISTCCDNLALKDNIPALKNKLDPAMVHKLNNLRNAIESDQTHDFWVGTRCIPQIQNCHKRYTVYHQQLESHFKEQNDNNRYSNINSLSNESFDYIIIDTKPHGISYSLINGKKKINMLTNVIDSAGCSFDNGEHHYSLVRPDLELFILNLGLGFYQSYFKYLRSDEYHYHIYLTISLQTNKKTFMQSKKYYIHITIVLFDGSSVDILYNPPYEASGGGSTNGEFSVPKICKMLSTEYNNYKFLTFLNNVLTPLFAKQLFNTLNPDKKKIMKANITSSICLLMKGFGDFGQMFTTCFLYNMQDKYTCPNGNKEENKLNANCMLTTCDTFLFRIADIFDCPIVLGTTNREYYLIDTSRKYSGKKFVDANNRENKLKIYPFDSTLYGNNFFDSLNRYLKNNALKTHIMRVITEKKMMGLSLEVKKEQSVSAMELFKLNKSKCKPTLLLNLNSILEFSKSYINNSIFNQYYLLFINNNFILCNYENLNEDGTPKHIHVLKYNNYFGDGINLDSEYPIKKDDPVKFSVMRQNATKNNQYIIYLNALSEYTYIVSNFKIKSSPDDYTLFQLIQDGIFAIEFKDTYNNFSDAHKTLNFLTENMPKYIEDIKKISVKRDQNELYFICKKTTQNIMNSRDTINPYQLNALLNQYKIIDDSRNIVNIHIKNIDSLILHIKYLEDVKKSINSLGDDDCNSFIYNINALLTKMVNLLDEFAKELLPILIEKINVISTRLLPFLRDTETIRSRTVKTRDDRIRAVRLKDTWMKKETIINNCNALEIHHLELAKLCSIQDVSRTCKHSFNEYIENIINVIRNIYNLYDNIEKLHIGLRNIKKKIDDVISHKIIATEKWNQMVSFLRSAAHFKQILKRIRAKNLVPEVGDPVIGDPQIGTDADIEKVTSAVTADIDNIRNEVKKVISDIEEYEDDTYYNDGCYDDCHENICRQPDDDAPAAKRIRTDDNGKEEVSVIPESDFEREGEKDDMDNDGAEGSRKRKRGGGSTKVLLYLAKIEKLRELNKKLRKNKTKNKNKIEKNNKEIDELKIKIKKEKEKEKIKKEKQKEKEKIKKEKQKETVKKQTKQQVKTETKQKEKVKKETKQKQQVKKQKDEKTKKK